MTNAETGGCFRLDVNEVRPFAYVGRASPIFGIGGLYSFHLKRLRSGSLATIMDGPMLLRADDRVLDAAKLRLWIAEPVCAPDTVQAPAQANQYLLAQPILIASRPGRILARKSHRRNGNRPRTGA